MESVTYGLMKEFGDMHGHLTFHFENCEYPRSYLLPTRARLLVVA
jgi:hypothetical protein